jgi:hypothetical protein
MCDSLIDKMGHLGDDEEIIKKWRVTQERLSRLLVRFELGGLLTSTVASAR